MQAKWNRPRYPRKTQENLRTIVCWAGIIGLVKPFISEMVILKPIVFMLTAIAVTTS